MPVKLEIWQHPELSSEDIIVFSDNGDGKKIVLDCSSGLRGVRHGTSLNTVLSRFPYAVLLESNVKKYTMFFERIVSKLLQITPKVECAQLGQVYFQTNNTDGVLNSDKSVIISQILDVIPSFLRPRIGLAVDKFTAYAAAFVCESGRFVNVAGKSSKFLYPLSIDLLPVGEETIARLHKFGIHTIGQLASQNHAAIQAQLGFEGSNAWNLSCGNDPRRVVPIRNQERVLERISLPFPTVSRELIFTMIDLLVRRACSQPVMKDRYASKIVVTCSMVNGALWSKVVSIKQPSSSPLAMFAVLRSVLSECQIPGPVEDVAIDISELTGEKGIQISMFTDVSEDGKDRHNRVARIDQDLQSKMDGGRSIFRILDIDLKHPIPEMRVIRIPIGSSINCPISLMNLPKPISVVESNGVPVLISLTKNLRLSERVKVVDIWKIDLWWMPTPVSRTYYVIKFDSGRVMTVFQDMLGHGWYFQNY